MKIRLRFLIILVMLIVLATDSAFSEYFTSDPDAPMVLRGTYGLIALSAMACFYYYRYLPSVLRWWLGLSVVSIAFLVLEAYKDHNSWFVYPHVFLKVLVLLMPMGIYVIHRRFGMPPMRMLAVILLIGLLGNLLLYHSDSLSLSAFVDNERGFTVPSTHLFLLLALLSLNWYLQRPSLISMGVFFLCLALIVFIQHRTVWVCTAIALLVNLLLLRRVPTAVLSWRRISLLVLFPLVIVSVGGLATILDNPDVVRRIESSIEDIRNPNKQGTGEWRRLQREAYMPFIEERPMQGWGLEGFELPIQFYDPSSNLPMWEDRTGHHFHSFYIDRLFYFGIIGLLLVLVFPCWIVYRRLRQPGPLAPETAALTAFGASFLVYAYSYDWAFYHYAFIGFILAALAEPVAIAAPVSVPFLPLPGSASWPPSPLPTHLTART